MPHLKLVTPDARIAARRRPNAELRTREHLTEREVERLIEAAKGNRQGHRDATMIMPSCTSVGSRPARLRPTR